MKKLQIKTMMKRMKSRTAIILLSIIALGLASCAEQGGGRVSRSAQPYNYEVKPLHPQVRVFHDSEDSSTIYFSLNTAELLYARVDPNKPFLSNAIVHARVFHGRSLIDSASFHIVDTNSSKYAKLLNGELRLAIPDTLEGKIELLFSDQLKRTRAQENIAIDKSDLNHHHNYLALTIPNNQVVYGSSVPPGSRVRIIYGRSSDESFYIKRFNSLDKLPPPPFSYYNPEPIANLQFSSNKLAMADGNNITILPESGYYHISRGEFNTTGIGFHVRYDDFPELTKLEHLLLPLRYITSRKEFDAISLSNEAKLELDDFWLECGGSADKAKELIEKYYGRVEEANRYFSSYLEGWKSDRGLIHIVYGNPTKVVQKEGYETWIYGEENNLNTLSFSFKEEQNYLSPNHYVLIRDPIYKNSWSRAVDSWRNGRIYND
jgi:GWxTD domain-containing protein